MSSISFNFEEIIICYIVRGRYNMYFCTFAEVAPFSFIWQGSNTEVSETFYLPLPPLWRFYLSLPLTNFNSSFWMHSLLLLSLAKLMFSHLHPFTSCSCRPINTRILSLFCITKHWEFVQQNHYHNDSHRFQWLFTIFLRTPTEFLKLICPSLHWSPFPSICPRMVHINVSGR